MNQAPEIYCVRANYGQYTSQFLKGGYIAIGWLEEDNLSTVKNRAEIQVLYKNYHDDTSPYVIGQQVGQIARFLFDIVPGDYVIVPAPDTDFIYWGVVEDKPYFFGGTKDGCPFPHRRPVKWNNKSVRRAEFSVPFQNTIRSTLTVFWIKHKQTFFEVIGKAEYIPKSEQQTALNYYESVIRRILELDFKEFELLITEILKALGFEAQHTGKVGDEGIDVKGDLDIANMAKIKLFVQVKRYDIHHKINDRMVKALRQNIPFGGQGAFITTSDFQHKALDAAVEQGFPRIGTINGNQLVDLLVEKWTEIPVEFREKLGLRLGLISE
jgi:predicted Mrr-cat superfamily restriction endonuclease